MGAGKQAGQAAALFWPATVRATGLNSGQVTPAVAKLRNPIDDLLKNPARDSRRAGIFCSIIALMLCSFSRWLVLRITMIGANKQFLVLLLDLNQGVGSTEVQPYCDW
ncbi:MAG: hypothetical protein F4X02_13175 [Chloroflexi bacterium]|nr:hypothetical protein [Chloroflexota bacterium]